MKFYIVSTVISIIIISCYMHGAKAELKKDGYKLGKWHSWKDWTLQALCYITPIVNIIYAATLIARRDELYELIKSEMSNKIN